MQDSDPDLPSPTINGIHREQIDLKQWPKRQGYLVFTKSTEIQMQTRITHEQRIFAMRMNWEQVQFFDSYSTKK